MQSGHAAGRLAVEGDPVGIGPVETDVANGRVDFESGTCLVDAENETGDVVRDGLAFGCPVDVEQSDEAVADEHAELSGHEHVTGRVGALQDQSAGFFRDRGDGARRDFRGRFGAELRCKFLRDELSDLPVAFVHGGRGDVRRVAGLRDRLRLFQLRGSRTDARVRFAEPGHFPLSVGAAFAFRDRDSPMLVIIAIQDGLCKVLLHVRDLLNISSAIGESREAVADGFAQRHTLRCRFGIRIKDFGHVSGIHDFRIPPVGFGEIIRIRGNGTNIIIELVIGPEPAGEIIGLGGIRRDHKQKDRADRAHQNDGGEDTTAVNGVTHENLANVKKAPEPKKKGKTAGGRKFPWDQPTMRWNRRMTSGMPIMTATMPPATPATAGTAPLKLEVREPSIDVKVAPRSTGAAASAKVTSSFMFFTPFR